jgi:hypothetical protein
LERKNGARPRVIDDPLTAQTGTAETRFTEGWIAVIPEPGTALLVLPGCLGCGAGGGSARSRELGADTPSLESPPYTGGPESERRSSEVARCRSEVRPSRAGGRSRSARVTVDAIVTAAERVVEREGTRRATTNRIAETAGVSIGSLYQYFPNKGCWSRPSARARAGAVRVRGAAAGRASAARAGSAGSRAPRSCPPRPARRANRFGSPPVSHRPRWRSSARLPSPRARSLR